MGGYAMKRDIRIITLDLDGTLLNSRKELTESKFCPECGAPMGE